MQISDGRMDKLCISQLLLPQLNSSLVFLFIGSFWPNVVCSLVLTHDSGRNEALDTQTVTIAVRNRIRHVTDYAGILFLSAPIGKDQDMQRVYTLGMPQASNSTVLTSASNYFLGISPPSM